MKIYLLMLTMIVLSTGCWSIGNIQEDTMPLQPIVKTEVQAPQVVSTTPHKSQLAPLQRQNLSTQIPIPITLELENLIQIVINDLADRISVEPEQVELIDITEETWQDTSLDCPQPGVMYTPIIDPGYRIILQGIDILYEYHTDSNNLVVYCRSGITLPGKVEGSVQDGWPNQPKDGDVIIVEPTEKD